MIITNESLTRKIEISRLETLALNDREHRLAVTIETEHVRGYFDYDIWICEGDIHRFLEDLAALDKTRTGKAVLQDNYYQRFKLTFEGIDGLGHLSATVQLFKEPGQYKGYFYDVTLGMEIDPTILPRLRVELLELIK